MQRFSVLALVLSGTLHATMAYLLGHAAVERAAPASLPAKEATLFVELLPDNVPNQETRTSLTTRASPTQPTLPDRALEQTSSSQPARLSEVPPPARPQQKAAPAIARQRSPPPAQPKKAPVPSAPKGRARETPSATQSSSLAQDGPTVIPAPDFRWRPEDVAAQGMQRARGKPTVNLVPKAKAEPSELAKGIAKSARPYCAKAYAHLGLLALPFLLADTVRDGDCNW